MCIWDLTVSLNDPSVLRLVFDFWPEERVWFRAYRQLACSPANKVMWLQDQCCSFFQQTDMVLVKITPTWSDHGEVKLQLYKWLQHCTQKQAESCPPRGHAFKVLLILSPTAAHWANTSGFMLGWNVKCRCPKVHPCLIFILCSGRFQELGHIAAKSEPCSFSSVEVACKVSFSPDD